MRHRMVTRLALVAVCLGFAVSRAEPAESRFFNFAIPCDGTSKQVFASVTGLTPSTNHSIQGTELTLIQSNAGQEYVLLSASGIANRTLLSLGAADTHAVRNYQGGLFTVPADASGNVKFVVAGACQAGAGTVHGFAIINFTS